MKRVRSFLFLELFYFIFHLISINSYAAGEVLPNFATDQDMVNFISVTQRQIPFSAYNNQNYITLQQQGIASLRNQFPQYDEWMKAKPNPITIEIFQEYSSTEIAMFLREPHLSEIYKKVQEQLRSELAQTQNLQTLNERGLARLYDILSGSNSSVRGILVGLAQALPPEQKTEFLKIGNPLAQIEHLEKLEISDAVLRASAFKASTLGLDQSTVTTNQVLEIARRRVDITTSVFLHLSYLKLLSKAKSLEELKTTSALLNGSDFDFATRDSDPFLQKTLGILIDRAPKLRNSILQTTESFQNSVPRTWFEQKQTVVKNYQLLGKVTEVHPYLAVHRGCIGGDCSTTNSPMFPYSPWEHDFFIQNQEGKFVGYISANRLKANGIDSLYIRDLQGAQLSPQLAEAILHAMPSALEHFGVKQFVLANPNFTNSQNNSQILRNMMAAYYQKPELHVPLVFEDAAIRDYIGRNQTTFRSTYNYDAPQIHPNGVVFVPNKSLAAKLKFNIYEGTLPTPEPRTIAQAFLAAVKSKLKNPNLNAREFPELNANQLAADLQAWENVKYQSVASYYKAIEEILGRYGMQFSRTLFDQNEDLFSIGHLRATDAFKSDYSYLQERLFSSSKDSAPSIDLNSAIFKLSEKLLIQMARHHNNFSGLMEIVSKNKNELLRSKKFHELLKLYSERMQPQDVYQLIGFKEAGIEEAATILANEKIRPQIELAIFHLLQNGPEHLGLLNLANSQILRIWEQYQQGNQYPEGLFNLYSAHLKVYGLTMEGLENPNLKKLLYSSISRAFFLHGARDQNAFEKVYRLISTESHDLLESHEHFYILRWFSMYNIDSKIAQMHIEHILKNLTHEGAFELSVLASWTNQTAKEAINRPEVQKLLQEVILSQFGGNKELQKKIDGFIEVANAKPVNYRPVQWPFQLAAQAGSVTTVVQNIDSQLKPFGLSFATILQNEEVRVAISSWWMSLKDLFSNPSSQWLSINLEMALIHLKTGKDTTSVDMWSEIIENYSYLSQKPAFKKFIDNVKKSAFDENCTACVEGLARLHSKNLISDPFTTNRALMTRMIEVGSPFLVTYAFIRAYNAKIAIPFNESNLKDFSAMYEEAKDKKSAYYSEVFHTAILKLFAKIKTHDEDIRGLAQKAMNKSPANSMALTAALAFMRNGGSSARVHEELTKKYDREELYKLQDQENESLFRRVNNRVHHDTGFCKNLF